MNLDLENLKTFLIDAKKQTYANGDAGLTKLTRQCSKDYQFEKEIDGKLFSYHDTYFGTGKFAGEEVVYVDGICVWTMVYYGASKDESLSGQIYNLCLRPALMNVGKDKDVLSLRGPKSFKNGDFTYTFSSKGDLLNFEGKEEIFFKNKKVYQLICCGGEIL